MDSTKLKEARRGVRRGRALAEATCLARDLVNHPGGEVTPAYLARTARRLAKTHDLRCRIFGAKSLAELGMDALVAVGQGSANKPRFIVLEHGPREGDPLVFVGKGITFDSGGLSLKTVEGIRTMKTDMSGAAAVLGAMQAVAALGLKRRVVGLIAAAENMPSSTAFRPDDVLRTPFWQDYRDHQYGRRRPPRPGRCPRLRQPLRASPRSSIWLPSPALA